jgi:hypothetical protein
MVLGGHELLPGPASAIQNRVFLGRSFDFPMSVIKAMTRDPGDFR